MRRARASDRANAGARDSLAAVFLEPAQALCNTRTQHTVLRLRPRDVLTMHLDDGDVDVFVLDVFPLPHLARRSRLLDSALVSVQLS